MSSPDVGSGVEVGDVFAFLGVTAAIVTIIGFFVAGVHSVIREEEDDFLN